MPIDKAYYKHVLCQGNSVPPLMNLRNSQSVAMKADYNW